MTPYLVAMIKWHEEGNKCALTQYKDSLGYWTIGYGWCIDHIKEIKEMLDNGGSIIITETYATMKMMEELYKCEEFVNENFRTWSIGQVRLDCLTNMAYNLGCEGLMQFHRTLSLLESHDFEGAAEQCLKSKWAEQVGQRALDISEMFRTGEYFIKDRIFIEGSFISNQEYDRIKEIHLK